MLLKKAGFFLQPLGISFGHFKRLFVKFNFQEVDAIVAAIYEQVYLGANLSRTTLYLPRTVVRNDTRYA